MNSLDTPVEIAQIYNTWLGQNFHQIINTNPFQPKWEDDMDVIHEFDPYDYLVETFIYNNGFDDSMFDEPPNLELHSGDDEDDDDFDSFEYSRNI